MATEWTPPIWRMPNEKNQSKLENYSIFFDSTLTNRINCGSASAYDKFTLSAWVNRDASAVSNAAFFGTRNGFSGGFPYLLGTDSTDKFRFIITDGSGHLIILSNDTITDDQWYHVVGTCDGTTIKLYIDGVLQSSTASITLPLTTPNNDLMISGHYDTDTQYEWYGKIGQCCLFDYALSETQIKYLYNNNAGGTTPNPQNPMAIAGSDPIAYYPLGNNSTGSTSPAPTTLTVPNVSIGNDTVFDFVSGSSQYIDVGTVESINNATKYTIAFWGKKDGATDRLDIGSVITGTNRLLLNWNTSGNVNFAPNNGATGLATSALAHDTEWHHFAGVFDGTVATTDRCILYIDGVEATKTLSGIPTALSATAGNAFEIGAQTGASFANGEISNVVAFDTNLPATGTESIEALYNNGAPNQNIGSWSNLQGWWKLNGTKSTWDGSNWEIENNAITPNYTTALDFNGSTGHIDLGNDIASLKPTGAFSISLWVKSDSISTYQGLFTATPGGTTGGYWLVFNGSKARFGIHDGVGIEWVLSPTLASDTWYHIVGVWDGSSTSNIYVNTVGSTSPNTGVTSINYSGTIQHLIGDYAGLELNGKMSNVAFWDSELSQANINTLYNNGTPETNISLSPKSWWKLDNTTTGIQDDGSESNNGTIAGGVTEVNAYPVTTNGLSDNMTTANLITSNLTRSVAYSSYSMNFDGTDNIDLSSVYTTTNQFTVSIWANSTAPFPTGSNFGYYFGDGGLGIGIQEGTSGTYGQGIIYFWDGANGESLTATVVTPGVWEHIVFVCDKTVGSNGEIKLYRNGALDTTTTLASADLNNLTGIEHIGNHGTAHYYIGNLSNPAIWSSALTQDQILTLYNGGAPNDISSLSPIHWWSLAGDSYYNGSNWIYPDISTNSNNGTGNGLPTNAFVGDAPGSTNNGVGNGLTVPGKLRGDAPNSTANSNSVNMDTLSRVAV